MSLRHARFAILAAATCGAVALSLAAEHVSPSDEDNGASNSEWIEIVAPVGMEWKLEDLAQDVAVFRVGPEEGPYSLIQIREPDPAKQFSDYPATFLDGTQFTIRISPRGGYVQASEIFDDGVRENIVDSGGTKLFSKRRMLEGVGFSLDENVVWIARDEDESGKGFFNSDGSTTLEVLDLDGDRAAIRQLPGNVGHGDLLVLDDGDTAIVVRNEGVTRYEFDGQVMQPVWTHKPPEGRTFFQLVEAWGEELLWLMERRDRDDHDSRGQQLIRTSDGKLVGRFTSKEFSDQGLSFGPLRPGADPWKPTLHDREKGKAFQLRLSETGEILEANELDYLPIDGPVFAYRGTWQVEADGRVLRIRQPIEP